jgi:hypothetical protein
MHDPRARPEERAPRNPDENEKERLDRNMRELNEGLRVALPGVQVLFAFLLVVPFQQGWDDVTSFQRDIYYVTLLATALAAICLIGPSARHRARFRQGDKRWVVMTGNSLARAGVAFLGVAMCGAVLLITDVLFSLGAAIVAASLIGAVILWVWFAAAALRAARDKGD